MTYTITFEKSELETILTLLGQVPIKDGYALWEKLQAEIKQTHVEVKAAQVRELRAQFEAERQAADKPKTD